MTGEVLSAVVLAALLLLLRGVRTSPPATSRAPLASGRRTSVTLTDRAYPVALTQR